MKNKRIIFLIIISIFIIFLILGLKYETNIKNENEYSFQNKNYNNTFNIIASTENKELEEIIYAYAEKKGFNLNIDYDGTINIMQKLNQNQYEKQYDAVWISNSIWLYMLDDSIKISNSKYTNINPVIFGITKSKAEELGFVGQTIYTKDIVQAISEGKLKFSMPNVTSTNSGASAYLGLLSTLAGNPEVLKVENLENEELKNKLVNLFSGMERTSGSEEFLEEMFIKGNYEALMTYESSIININQKLEAQGKEILYAIYPVDGVSISDSPLAYINNGLEHKEEMFLSLQNYILSDEGQSLLQQKGRRTWYGGINLNADKNIFNPNWGIDTTKYITPIKYPSTTVIKKALNLYQNELRKPTHIVFCLDFSGSMEGEGYEQLKKAMNYILTEEAENDLLQFAQKDKIDIVVFNSNAYVADSTENGKETTNLLNTINKLNPHGATALYPAAIEGLELLKNEDLDTYNCSIILMTDGLGNEGTYSDLLRKYQAINKQIPIYSIMFGSADERQLEEISNLTNAKVFNGKTDLIQAFKEVRGYN
ncbi:MAG: VWA domain-containing protein [Candidatus Scatovivens sp.]